MIKTIDAFEILSGYGLITEERNQFNFVIGYHDPDLPHLVKEASKSTTISFKQAQRIDILKLIKDTVPSNLEVRHVYASINGTGVIQVFLDHRAWKI